MQDGRFKRVFTEVKNRLVFKARFRPSIAVMPDFQGQFIPDGRSLICKGALTIGLGFNSGDSKDASVR